MGYDYEMSLFLGTYDFTARERNCVPSSQPFYLLEVGLLG